MKLVQAFQEMKRIHGFCPCCGELFRLSEATLFTKGAPPRTPFDEAERAEEKVQRAIERFDGREAEIRERATELGKKLARRKLRKIAGYFTERGLDPQDVKALFDPVDYVAFPGLHGERVSRVELIDRPATTARKEKVQATIRRTLRAGNVEWRTWRIDADEGSVEEEGS
jgi:predicted Holliday junction resolvase-like endonuclease